MADPYQRQVAPGKTTDSLPFANANDYGGQIGEAIIGLGEQQGRQNVADRTIEIQRERDRAGTQAMVDFAKAQEVYSETEIDAKMNAGPGAEGHRKQMDEALAKVETDLLGTITDEKVREAYRGRFAAWKADRVIQAEAYERGETVKLMVTNAGTAIDIKANQLSRATASNEDFANAVLELRAGVGDLEGVPADIRMAMEKDGVGVLTASYLKGRDPNETKALIGSGAFDGFLSPAQMEQIANGADIDIRREKMEAAATARLEKAAAKEELDQLLREITDGVPHSDEELATAAEKAAKFGLDKDGYDLGKARVEGQLNREFQTATPAQIDAEVKKYDARIAKAGDNASVTDIVARDHLIGILSTRTKDVAKDPLTAGAKMGIDVQEVDWSNSGSVAARRRGADASAKALGVPPVYLTDEEVTQMRSQMDTPAGLLAVSSQLRQLGGKASRRAAQQVDPSNSWFHASLGLNDTARQMIYNGDKLLSTKQISVSANDTQPRWRQYAMPAMALLPTEAKGAVLQMAVRIYAQASAKMGLEDFDEDIFDSAINSAMGGTRRGDERLGGIGEYNGAKMVLPNGMSQSRFDGLIGALDFSKAKVKPLYRNGTAIPADVLRRDWTPVLSPSGQYRFQNSRGEYAGAAGNATYEIDFNILDRRLPASLGTTPKLRATKSPSGARSAYEALPQVKLRGQQAVYKGAP